jgi:glutathione reductase (NADPH)
MADKEVDLFVIGAGSGGVRAARIAAGHGASVMVAEEFRVGGTCVIRGCVPKKLLVYAARFADDFEDAAGYGWTLGEPVFDWPTLIANKDREIARLELAYTSALERANVKIVASRAVLEDAHTLRLTATGERVRAKTILIATGSAPYPGAQIAGLEHVISSNEAFHLSELPPRIFIQGGGYIALEFAGIFNGLGSEVTLVYRGDNILRGFDDDVREHLRSEMERRGIKIITRQTVDLVAKVEHGYCVELADHKTFTVDRVMFATGRRPNVSGLGLEAAGVALAKNGGIAVNEFSQTCVPHIYAIGDVTNRINLTPVAIREGHAFADTVFGGKQISADHADVPTAVFSEPEVGAVGMTEAQARDAGLDVVVGLAPLAESTRGWITGPGGEGLIKLVEDRAVGHLVGATSVGPMGGEVLSMLATAVHARVPTATLARMPFAYPTFHRAVETALADLRG